MTGAARRVLSILFADLVGFTELSERLDPEDVASISDGRLRHHGDHDLATNFKSYVPGP